MKLKTKLLVFYAILLAGLFGAFFLQQHLAASGQRSILQKEQEQRQLFFSKVTELKGHSLETLSIDYTFWDDMVNFVKTGNSQFAEDNLVTGLGTFSANVIWVYNPSQHLVYATNNLDKTPSSLGVQFPSGVFTKLHDQHLLHFFIKSDDLLLEVRAATIHPSDDETRQTEPMGYFFTAKVWDQAYAQSLADLTQSSIQITPPTAEVTQQPGHTAFVQQLKDWQNTSLATVQVDALSPITSQYSGSALRQLLVLVGFGLISLVGSAWFLIRSVEHPLAVVSHSIGQGDPGSLKPLASKTDEIGQLAKAVTQFYDQKIAIAQTEARNQELEKVSNMKDEFVSIASHQLRTPASAVKGFLSLVLGQDNHDEQLKRQLLQSAFRENEQQLLIINDLLDMAQIDTGRYSLSKTPVDLGSLLHEVITEQELLLAGKMQQLVFADPPREIVIQADQQKLRMVFTNLINNASKYTPDNGKITIELKDNGPNVTLNITDTGVGMKKSDQEQLFKQFSRIGDETGRTPGTGLGLYIVKTILDLHGGTIEVSSKPNTGTRFMITLPKE